MHFACNVIDLILYLKLNYKPEERSTSGYFQSFIIKYRFWLLQFYMFQNMSLKLPFRQYISKRIQVNVFASQRFINLKKIMQILSTVVLLIVTYFLYKVITFIVKRKKIAAALGNFPMDQKHWLWGHLTSVFWNFFETSIGF